MNEVSGVISVPLAPGSPRIQGDVLLVKVLVRLGHDTWRVEQGSLQLTIKTSSDLVPGQQVKLRLVGLGSRPILSEPALPFGQPHLGAATATFVAQGLTLLPERLRALERWWKTTSWVPGPESDTWGRAWESRRWPENGPGSDNLLSWIVWEQNLLRGQAEPPPSQDGFWELWNSVPTVGSQRWVTCPFQWSIGTDTGWALLKAAIEPWRSEIHYWTVVAAPAHHPVRLSARKQNPGWIVQLQLLGLEDYQKAVSSWRDWTKGILAESPELSLELAGPTTPTLAAEVVFRQTGGVDEVR